MAVLDDIDPELMRLWTLISELSDQLSHNRAQVQALQHQAGQVKGQAIHCGTGFALRRFNTDISKETFESELERMNAHLVLENQSLLHENKQLNLLLKEYEQTLDVIMGKFRAQAHMAQQHDLTLIRHYEQLLLTSQTATLNGSLTQSAQLTESLSRLSHLLRAALRSLAGEPPSPIASSPISPVTEELEDPSQSPSAASSSPNMHTHMHMARGLAPPSEPTDWNLEREIELARLESENALLRSLLAISEGSPAETKTLLEEWDRENERPLGSGGGGFAHSRRGSAPRGRGRGGAMGGGAGMYGFGFGVPGMRGGAPGMGMGGVGTDSLGLR